MLSPKSQLSLRNAKEYFREHLSTGDYYAQGQKVTGEWFGQGAEKLGLNDAVRETDFLALCEGLNPATRQRLTARKNSGRQEDGKTVPNRRVFYDFTLSPPKSVSVVALLQDDRISELHNRAVRQAMMELEKFAETRVRKAGQNNERVTGNVVGAAFRHDTSRELDPHLHTHCVVFNATFDVVEGRWKALEVQGMYRAQKFAENLYYHELSKGLRSLGYEIENNARDFEIKNVPQSLITRFSKRHQQIDEDAQKRQMRDGDWLDVNTIRRRVAHDNRRRKQKNSTADQLRPSWVKQTDATERRALEALRPPKPGHPWVADVASVVAWADEHLFERRSVVQDYDLLSSALARGRGQDFDLEALRTAVERRNYLREEGTRRLTSREVLRCELGIVVTAHDGRGRHAALSRDFRPAPSLSAEQKAAVEQIMGSRDFITLFRGGAGTGKSFALKEVERGLNAAERPVVVLAPQRQQVTDLQKDGLRADTLSSFLQTKQLARGAVVIVDEAGQIGGRDLGQLIAVVQAHAGRLILSGDTRQHGAVAASDALRAIEKHAGLRPAEIRVIRRQDPSRGRSANERRFIREYRAAVKAAAKGNVIESFDRLDRLGCVRELDIEQRRDSLAAEYVAAVGRKQKALVVTQTRGEAHHVNEAIRRRLRACNKLGTDTTISTCRPLDLGEAQKRDPRFYQAGQYACFLKPYGRFAKGDLCEIAAATERGVVVMKNGRRSTVSYRYSGRFTVAMASSIEIAPGDRLQLKFNGKSREGAPLNNGELVTVRHVRKNGALVVDADSGGRKTLEPSQRLLVRGYAVTSYGSQGKTVDTVLFADAANRAATNANQWYVAISRGRKNVVVFTSDKGELRTNVQRTGDRDLALDMKPTSADAAAVDWTKWRQRALAAAESHRRHQAVMVQMQRHDQRRRVAV